MHCELTWTTVFLLLTLTKMHKYCNKCVDHCSFILVNTLTNVNKWHLIVKCYH